MDLSVSQRLAVGFGVALALLAGELAVSLVWLGRIGEQRNLLTDVIAPRSEMANALQTALLNQAIAAHSFALTRDPTFLRRHVEATAEEQAAFRRLESLPKDPDGRALLDQIDALDDAYFHEIDGFVDLVKSGAEYDRIQAAEVRLSSLRTKLLEHADKLQSLQQAETQKARATVSRTQSEMASGLLGLTGLVLAAFAATALLTARAVRRPARDLVRAARALAEGDYGPALAWSDGSPSTGTAPGARSPTRAFRDELRELAGAFGRMAAALRGRENRLAASDRLSSSLAASLEVERLTDDALREMISYTGSTMGAVYVLDPGSSLLKRVAAFALDGTASALALGEGIPGQAAAGGKTILVREIPNDSPFRIRFGLDEVPPRCIVASPILFGLDTVGVVVVGSLRELTQDEVDFIDHGARQLGVSLQNAYSHRRAEQLASELQDKNEELRAQNEELQGQSEEIQAQNEKFQAQAEEIRAHTDQLRQAMMKLEESEERFRRIVECRAVGIAQWNLEGAFTDANDAFLGMLGYERTEIVSGKVRWTDITPEEYRERDETAIQEMKRFGVCTPYEKGYRRKDGTLLPILLGCAFVGDSQDHGVAFIIDVSAQKRLERELQLKAEELAAADRNKDEFLAMLGHELRNPVAAICHAGYVLEQRSLGDTADRTVSAPFREIITRQAAHLARLVDDLLDIARITHGQIELRKQRVDLSEVVRSCVASGRPLIETRHHHLSVSVDKEPLLVEGDPARLEQILHNLLNNAAKYTDPGGRIHVTAERRGGEAVLCVRDTGIGISPDLLPRVFDLFMQGEPSADGGRQSGGLGLGLALVRKLAELHGGKVEARSAGPGRGAEFTVHLPAVSPQAQTAPAREDERMEPLDTGRSLQILIVEDNLDLAQALAETVALWGHQVQIADDARTAIHVATANPPDVVLLDIGLPDMDGYQVARRLRAELPAETGTELIALTGYGQPEDRRRAHEAGFDHHLVKPVDIDLLRGVLAKHEGDRHRP